MHAQPSLPARATHHRRRWSHPHDSIRGVLFEGSVRIADEPQNKVCIEYVRDVPGVCGRLFTEKMMECVVSKETIERLKREERKNYLHILDVCEKKKCDLNASGASTLCKSLLEIGEVDLDLSDYIEFDGDQDMSFLQVKIDAFSARCAPLVARFRAALQEMCEVVRGFHDSTPLVKVLPSGGAMRTLCLQQELKRAVQSLGWRQADLTHTLNMDEPVALGAATLAHLLEQKSVKVDKSVVGVLVFSEDCVDWKEFSTKESDVEICMRESAMEIERNPSATLDSRDRRANRKGVRA